MTIQCTRRKIIPRDYDVFAGPDAICDPASAQVGRESQSRKPGTRFCFGRFSQIATSFS